MEVLKIQESIKKKEVHDCKYDCLYCTYPMLFLFSILYPPMPWSSLTPENYTKMLSIREGGGAAWVSFTVSMHDTNK
jgi:hypothetical protein